MIKYFACLLLRFLLRLLYIFPVKEGVVILTSFGGRQYSCNPKYIAEYIIKNTSMQVYFAINMKRKDEIPCKIKLVKYRSLKHLYYLMTCEFIIVNSSDFTKYLPYRKKQKYINTWHGAFIFKIGDQKKRDNYYGKKMLSICGKELNHYIRNCTLDQGPLFIQNIDSKSKYLDIGYPRSDIFFNSNINKINYIKNKVGIDNNKKIILYAPTYRDSYNNDDRKNINSYGFEILDVDRVLNIFDSRFGESHILLFRAHHDMLPDNISTNAINVSGYPDMQELLLISDFLITDYSTSMIDFSIQGKPGFLYTPDLDNFKFNIPSFNPINQWPYLYAENNDDFSKLVEQYNSRIASEKIKKFLDRIGCCDEGKACERLCQEIFIK